MWDATIVRLYVVFPRLPGCKRDKASSALGLCRLSMDDAATVGSETTYVLLPLRRLGVHIERALVGTVPGRSERQTG
jgi:hypothetical protein